MAFKLDKAEKQHEQELLKLKHNQELEKKLLKDILQKELDTMLLYKENLKTLNHEKNSIFKDQLQCCETSNNEFEEHTKQFEGQILILGNNLTFLKRELESTKILLEDQKLRSSDAINQLRRQNNLIAVLQSN